MYYLSWTRHDTLEKCDENTLNSRACRQQRHVYRPIAAEPLIEKNATLEQYAARLQTARLRIYPIQTVIWTVRPQRSMNDRPTFYCAD